MPGVVRLDKRGREVGGAGAVVVAALDAIAVAIVRLAVLAQPFGAAGLVGRQVGRDAVFGAGLAVFADPVARHGPATPSS